MISSGVLLAHKLAIKNGKLPYFFSGFNFERMRKFGNTHYCFKCGGGVGFKPGPSGEVTNCTEKTGWNTMPNHDPILHADAVVGKANEYERVDDWVFGEINPDSFPLVVCITG